MDDIVEQVARAIHLQRYGEDCWGGHDNAARLAQAEKWIAAVRAADKEAGMVLVRREDVERLRLSSSLRPDECHCEVCKEHNAGLDRLRAALEDT